MIHYIARASLYRLVAIGPVAPQMKARIVDFESAIESWRGAIERIENQRTDERAGVISLRAQ